MLRRRAWSPRSHQSLAAISRHSSLRKKFRKTSHKPRHLRIKNPSVF